MVQGVGWMCATHPPQAGYGTSGMAAHVAAQSGTHSIVNCYHVYGQAFGSMKTTDVPAKS